MVVLHIGTDKTGSTAIQKLISSNRKWLEAMGWFYPKKVGNFGYGHERLSIDLEKNKYDVLQELKNELQASSLENTLLSYEVFYNLKEEQIKKLLSAFNSTDKNNIKIIIYLRRQDEKKESGVLQHIKAGFLNQYNQYDYKYESMLDYYPIIEKWSKFINKENIIIRPYGKEFLPDKYSLYEDFFKYALNIDFSEIKDKLVIPEKDPNPSIDAVSGLVANFFSKTIKGELKNTLISQMFSFQNRYGKSKANLFNTSERKKILSLYKEGNKLLVSEYNIPDKLFKIDDKSFSKPSDAEITERLSYLYKRINYLLPLNIWAGKGHLQQQVNQNKILLINGFYGIQENVLYTKGNESSKFTFLVLRHLYNSDKHLNLNIKCTYLSGSNTVSYMKIGNGEWIKLSNDNQYSIPTKDIREDGGVVFVELKHTNAISPKNLNGSDDNRIIGCLISSISLTESN